MGENNSREKLIIGEEIIEYDFASVASHNGVADAWLKRGVKKLWSKFKGSYCFIP